MAQETRDVGPSMAESSPSRISHHHGLDGLVARFPAHLTALLLSDAPVLAAEAAAILARLGITEAVDEVARLARRPETVARRAGVEALGFMPAEKAGRVVMRALDDTDWTVRKAALTAIAQLAPTGAARELRRRISNRRFASRDEVEQAAFLRALVAAGPEESIPELAHLLNGRKRWGGRHAAIVRAGAARALALVGTPNAAKELSRASGDRNSTVASAVSLCLRHLEQNTGTLPEEDQE